MTDAEYPYFSGDTGDNGTCEYVAAQAVGTISSFSYATPPCASGACETQNDILLAQNLYQYGPVGIIVDASQWQDYTFGVFNNCNNDYADMDHGVQVVGWGDDSGLRHFMDESGEPMTPPHPAGTVAFWIVRNSWADSWGQSGYIDILGSEYQRNTCGISNEAIYATI